MRLGTLALLSAAALSFGQTKPLQTRPAFEVATIKPDLDQSGILSWNISPSGRVTIRNMAFFDILRTAYNVRELQMSGGPAWIKTRRFDIEAQPEAQPAAGAAPVANSQVMQMLQALLEDRFQLKWHHDTREGSVYALTASATPKLPPAHEGRSKTMFGDFDAPSLTLDSLCQMLDYDLGRPVLNQTKLAGPFAIRLRWASERSPMPDAALPSIFTAVQEQLGLKLESTKAPLEFFIIDSVEAPSDN